MTDDHDQLDSAEGMPGTSAASATIDREQVEVAVALLEAAHGDALGRDAEREATAYYHALSVVEDALAESYAPENEPGREAFWNDVERSREARKEGYRAATLLGETRRPSHGDGERGLWKAIKEVFTR